MSSGASTVPTQCPQVARRSVFPGTPEHVGRVRRWLRTNLDTCPALDDAILLTSELVTNALEHTASGRGGSFAVAVFHRSADIRIEVVDEGAPWLPGDSSDELHGRGLVIVGAVARAWGITGDESGRTVWFELDCP